MKKKLILLLFALQMIVSVPVWADNQSDNLKDGESFTEKTVEGVEMTFKVLSTSDKTCQVGVGIINNKVNIALENYNVEGSITIPDVVNGYTVVQIGGSAFYNCSYLKSVVIPNSIKTIDAYAFYNCLGLTSITIPASTSYIGYLAFGRCLGLTSIVVDINNPYYDSRDNCNAIILTSGNTLMFGCHKTVIPNTIENIYQRAFYLYDKLESINIPASVKYIGEDAFYHCNGLTSITVDKSNLFFDSRDNCNAIIRSEDNVLLLGCKMTSIPDGVEGIANGAFQYCHFDNIVIPASVNNIGERAFSSCSLQHVISLSVTPTDIPDNAFENVDATLYVPLSAKSKYQSVQGWNQFKNIIGMIDFETNAQEGETFVAEVPGSGMIEGYPYLTGLQMKFRIISKSEKTCAVASDQSMLKEFGDFVHIPAMVNGFKVCQVDDAAFRGSKMSQIAIPGIFCNIKIGKNAFESCDNLKHIDLLVSKEEYCPVFGLRTFSNNQYASIDVTNPIGEWNIFKKSEVGYFVECFAASGEDKNMLIYHFTEDNTSCGIGYKHTDCWVNEEWVEYDGNLYPLYIHTYRQENHKGYVGILSGEIVVPNFIGDLPITEIGERKPTLGWRAFSDCNEITSITIPNGVVFIGSGSFRDCINLKSVISLLTEPFAINDFDFSEISYQGTLYVPANKKSEYESTDGWKNFEKILPIGDVNGDNAINDTDVKEETDYIMGNPSKTFVKAAADMNGDGVINIVDVVLMNALKAK